MKRLYPRKNCTVFLDDEDYYRLKPIVRWTSKHADKHSGFTVSAQVRKPDGSLGKIKLNRAIAGFPQGKLVTFVNKKLRHHLKKENLKVGGKRLLINFPIPLETFDDLVCKPVVEAEAARPVVESVLLPGGCRRFVPDPTSKLGPTVQYKLWAKQNGQALRGSIRGSLRPT